MSNITAKAAWVYGGTVVATAALTGGLPALLGLVGLAAVTRAVAFNTLNDEAKETHELEYERLVQGITARNMKAKALREQYELLRQTIGKNPTRKKAQLLEAALAAVHSAEASPEVTKAYINQIKRNAASGEVEKLFKRIDISADMLAAGTLLFPAVPLIMLAVHKISKK